MMNLTMALVSLAADPGWKPGPEGYQTLEILGWKLHAQAALLSAEPEATDKAVSLLRVQLAEVAKVVPGPALARLREVPLWFSREYPKTRPGAEYHPSAGWLKSNGRDPSMAKGVEFSNIRIFEQETTRMPNFALHELAHAYHDRVLGFENPKIEAAFREARDKGGYERVERVNGRGKPNTREKAYAMTNAKEYFAETTEAFFSRNDFFPFNRAELERHDPRMAALLAEAWGAAR